MPSVSLCPSSCPIISTLLFLGQVSVPCFQPSFLVSAQGSFLCCSSSISESVRHPLPPCPSSCPVFPTALSTSVVTHALSLKPLLLPTLQPLPYSLSFQRSLVQATPLVRAPAWRAKHPNLARRTRAALPGKHCSQSTAVANPLRRTCSVYWIAPHVSSSMTQYFPISHKHNALSHGSKQSSNVTLNVKPLASLAEMGLLRYSPSVTLQEDISRFVGRATSYPAEPIHNSMHVLRFGIQLEELYLDSLIAARNYMHVQLYGQMSFSFIRVDLSAHNTVLQLATQNASRLFLIFALFPLLQVLYMMLRAYLISNTTFYTRHSRKSTRARLRKHYSSCTRLAYRTFSCISVLYLCMFFMYIDPSSGRRGILTITYLSQSNTRRRRTTYSIPIGMKRFARQCDKAFTLMSSTYNKHQVSIDGSSMLACWMWTAVYSITDPFLYTGLCIPPAESFAGALLIMHFLSPIVPTIYEIFLQPAILPRYHQKKRRLPGIRRTRAGLDLEVPPLWKRVPDPHGGLPA
jgi:hypothetical protein